ncbi:hypothetical protein TNCV_3320141 [Trichonephila clavipes]|nr:hypothetical protein TNCV_3320141 [Trichonephila clavipes]
MENQLVLLKDPNTKPLDWPMGRILEVFPGSDGLVRVVNVKTSTAIHSGYGSLEVQVSDGGWLVTSSSLVPRKTRRVGERCTLNLSRAQTSSRWCGVVFRRGGASSDVVLIT